ncbi:MAG: rhomboid family intramembrane serine protease [Pirellulaceae bacterium]|jgi:membrane associated rhomboid family serine protease|nr:rhomboid family intramembrane serine protease [Pirellulaceae bacterium]
MTSLAENAGKELKTILIFAGVIWGVFFLSLALPLADYGVHPRTWLGLIGIVTMPLLHATFGHLVGNTLPLIVLLFLLVGSRARSWRIVLEISILSGVLVWLLGRDANYVGASALIYGLIAFLVLGGFLERRPIPIVVAAITFLFYGGSLLWGLVPRPGPVAWDAHLWGAVAGGVVAFHLARPIKWRRKTPVPETTQLELTE